MSFKNNSLVVGFLGKYSGLSISLLLLILLIVTLLIFNILFSNQLQKSAEISSLAGEQGISIQQVSKDLFAITSQYQKVLPYEKEKENLGRVMSDFELKLNAFSNGGAIDANVETEDGWKVKTVQIPAARSTRAVTILEESSSIWENYKINIAPIIEKTETNIVDLSAAADYTADNNQRLTELMGNLSEEIQLQSEKNLNFLRIAQIIGIALAVFMFFFTIFYTVRNLQKNDRELDQARQESTGILNTIREGLFLIDREMVVSSQYSNEMEVIFEKTEIGECQFNELMEGILSQSDLQTAQEYIKLLFDPHIIVDLTDSLNPLEEIMVNITRKDGTAIKKYLNFSFFQVMKNDEVHDVLVSIREITGEVLLKEQLELTKVESDQHVKMLMSFLHASPAQLNSFIIDAQDTLSAINNILKEPISDDADFRKKTDRIFIEIHRLKGEASSFDFDSFAEKAHEFEDELSVLSKTEFIEGTDFISLAILLDKLIKYTEMLYDLSSLLKNYKGSADSSAKAKNTKEWSQLSSIAEKVANDSEKKVEIVISGLSEQELNESSRRFVSAISTQLIRNSVVHGIENSEDRIKKQKSETGLIHLNISKLSDGTVKLIVRDDGKGIDFKKIRKTLSDKGFLTKEKLEFLSNNKIIKAVFMDDFSTANNVSMHAGRGVGLGVVREKIVAAGGRLKLRQRTDEFCEFEVFLPPEVA